jgi:ABC-2 type transport system ATP-binding protein
MQIPLQVDRLYKRFQTSSLFREKRAFVAVDHISFELKPGEILGLLGSNGAGKTTTIQMLLGTLTPTSGQITYFGRDFAKERSALMQHVSFASTYVRLPGRLSVYENLDFYAKLYCLPLGQRKERIERFLKQFDLWHLRDREAGALSAGETTRAIVAKAFLSDPKVVLLDEPTASLDPDIAHEVRRFVIEQRKQHGVSILFTSHNMDEVTAVCDRVLIMKHGVIVAQDTPAQLAARVSKTRIEFVSEHCPAIGSFAAMQNLTFTMTDRSITVQIDEHQVAQFLTGLSKQALEYNQISIEKPNLEDYFLQVAQRSTR